MKTAYKTVHELSRAELDELKESYFYQLINDDDEVPFAVNNGDEDDVNDISYPSDIPDDIIFNHYDGIMFVNDDFFCNNETEDN